MGVLDTVDARVDGGEREGDGSDWAVVTETSSEVCEMLLFLVVNEEFSEVPGGVGSCMIALRGDKICTGEVAGGGTSARSITEAHEDCSERDVSGIDSSSLSRKASFVGNSTPNSIVSSRMF